MPSPVTPGPGTCVDVARNGGFDYGMAGWYPSVNVLPVHIVANPVLSPPYALQLGAQSQQAKSYSSARQYLTLPPGMRVTLQFATWTWSEPAAGADRQEALLLAADNSVLAVLWRVLANEQSWRQVTVDLTPYSGRPVAIYFNVANDGAGGRTAMFLDNVQVLACGGSGPLPAPVTVLPPITLGTPEALREITDAAGAAPAGVNPPPVMTRIALEGPPGATPTARATLTSTPVPSPTPTSATAAWRTGWDELMAQVSSLGCLAGLAVLILLFVLIIWGIILPWANRPRVP